MARPKGDPHQFKARIEAALEVAKPRDVVSAEVMADILGMTWRNLLETYIRRDPAFPIKKRGSQGRGFEFQVIKVLRHLEKQCDRSIAELNKEAEKQARLTNVKAPPPKEGGPASLPEIKMTLSVTGEIEERKLRQKETLLTADVAETWDDLLAIIVASYSGAMTAIDPIGEFSPEQRARGQDHFDRKLVELQAKIEACLEGRHANSSTKPPRA